MAIVNAKCARCGERFACVPPSAGYVSCPGCGVKLRVRAELLATRPALGPGGSLGPYEVLELIGRGAMGAVYKARHTKSGLLCALKVLPSKFTRDPSFVERFRREGRAAAAINHPNVIQVLEVGEEGGHHYIAMEYVEGESLGDRLKRDHTLPPEVARDLMRQTASALAAAHALGIVHRDIKPVNILLTTQGQVKVADFGLAKRSGVDVDVTMPGARLGTPLYMPPEMALGKPADARSDLYSLGATFYHALVGQSPVDAPTSGEVVSKLLHEQAPSLDEVAPHAPAELRRAVDRLVRKDPADRFQTARELLDALGGAVEVPQTSRPPRRPPPPPPPGAVRPATSRPRRRALAGAILGGTLLVGAIAAFLLLRGC